eukprot:8609606-Pyramimonas_sp.AAC.1
MQNGKILIFRTCFFTLEKAFFVRSEQRRAKQSSTRLPAVTFLTVYRRIPVQSCLFAIWVLDATKWPTRPRRTI